MAWPRSCILTAFFTFILLQLSSVAAQNGGKLTVGQSLRATGDGSPLLSPSGDFAFGFHQFPKNNDLFLLAIWYAKIQDTIVWYANNGNPVSQGSSVKITANEGLVLSNPQGTSLWSTTDAKKSGGAINYGFMNDTGNFVLNSETDDAVWQSFDNPTDTLLPTQILQAGGQLNSRRSETNFTQGRFQLRLQSDGNLVLNTRDLATGYAYDPYYASNTNGNGNPKNAGDRVIYNKSGDLYIQIKNNTRFDLTPADKLVSAQTNYQRVTLGFDGVLSWYYHPKSFAANKGVSWSSVKSLPDNICTTLSGVLDTGACGYNSICSLGDGDQRPKCRCPPNYSLLDPNDTYGSCKPDFKQDNCDEYGKSAIKDEYTLVRLVNIDWPLADYAQLKPCSKEECQSNCQNDCFCAAAIFNEQDQTCWKKKLPLTHGREDSGVNRIGWLKVGNINGSNDPINPIHQDKVIYKKNAVSSALFGSSVCINFLLLSAIVLGIFLMYNKKNPRSLDEHHRNKTLSEYSSVHCFSYKELEDATDGFREEVGRGAFGTVYKGKIGEGNSPFTVAVKKLDRISKEPDKEFKAEVNVIGQTHHKNLVRFIGFCKEEDQRLLVYEYMSNGTVADYLFGNLRPSWTARMQIVQGIARGLLYLHEECCTQIIHCDIKPQNILLDEYYHAQLASPPFYYLLPSLSLSSLQFRLSSTMAPKKDTKAAPSSKPAKSGGGKQKKKKWSKGKQKEKVNNLVLFDNATFDKLLSEAAKQKVVTAATLSERFRINGSLARRAIRELVTRGAIKMVAHHSSLQIYTRSTNEKVVAAA